MLKTNSIIDLLKLDKGFNQEEFSFQSFLFADFDNYINRCWRHDPD